MDLILIIIGIVAFTEVVDYVQKRVRRRRLIKNSTNIFEMDRKRRKIIKDDFGKNASKNYKKDLFDEEE